MPRLDSIVRIQDLVDRWRELGALKLPNGVELIAEIPDGDEPRWMHILFPGVSAEAVRKLEELLEVAIPTNLKAFYRGCGGMSLFSDAFTFYGKRHRGFVRGDAALEPQDLVAFHREVASFPWARPGSLAFASNGWDGSVYTVGAGETPDEVLRCDRATGEVTERHADVFTCAEARLYRLDQLAM